MDKERLENDLGKIIFHANPANKLVTIESVPPVFQVIGVGTDAVVVSHRDEPGKVFKVFAPGREHKKRNEWVVYQRLGNHPVFCRCYAEGKNYLVLTHERGPTLYECLEEGIMIPEQVIHDVEAACRYARSKGLNPRDIHLKNVLLQNGRAKLLDVSEYVRPGNDRRWDLLVWGYYAFYPLIRRRKVPTWMIEAVKHSYYGIIRGAAFLKKGWRWMKMWFGFTNTEEKPSKGDS